jgi:hypothetical protein
MFFIIISIFFMTINNNSAQAAAASTTATDCSKESSWEIISEPTSDNNDDCSSENIKKLESEENARREFHIKNLRASRKLVHVIRNIPETSFTCKTALAFHIEKSKAMLKRLEKIKKVPGKTQPLPNESQEDELSGITARAEVIFAQIIRDTQQAGIDVQTFLAQDLDSDLE